MTELGSFAVDVLRGGEGQTYSLPVQLLLLVTLLAVLPSLLLLMTSFTRFIIVLALLRQALGLGQTPPNMVLVGLALALTLVSMAPTWQALEERAIAPVTASTIPVEQGIAAAADIMKQFMLTHVRESDLARFKAMTAAQTTADADLGLATVLPAFVASELTTAFKIGAMLFIPFIVIDLMIAAVLTGMGMMMVSPAPISIPVKLLIFVMVDGWSMLFGSLAQGVAGAS